MCGIAGVWSADPSVDPVAAATRMADDLGHRGPDDRGLAALEDGRLALGHRRLSIQDLTADGAQPMTSHCDRFVVAFNGEIYNHWELRDALGGDVRWRGRSDTETLAQALATWGPEAALPRLVGMFALAAWDRERRTLILARDRIGEKPLYYGTRGTGTAFFASEVRALLRSGLGPFAVDGAAVDGLLHLGYVPEPATILEGVRKVVPGTWVEVRMSGGRVGVQAASYWNAAEAIADARAGAPSLSPGEWEERVEHALRRAVERQLIADVPVGAFLSGGVDSSLIAAMLGDVASGPVRTFTIAMPGDWNEAPRARLMADHLGTTHTEIPISEQDCLDVIPRLATVFSEPFGDSSQVPTYLVAQAARREVTVALSGDGGDEFFGGYNRYVTGRRIWNRLEGVPRPLRALGGFLAESRPGAAAGSAAGRLLSDGGRKLRRRLKFEKGMRLVGATSEREFYARLVSHWPLGQAPSPTAAAWRLRTPEWVEALADLDPAERFMARDLVLSLPGQMLTKVDRAAMAHSLETRAPFLDPDLIDVSFAVPIDLKLDAHQGKLVLRRILARHAPAGWFEAPEARQKLGFGIPVARWLRQELRDWAEALLEPAVLADNPYLDPDAVRLRWREFLGGRAWELPMFTVLLFQAWYLEHRNALSR